MKEGSPIDMFELGVNYYRFVFAGSHPVNRFTDAVIGLVLGAIPRE
ncbi:MAG: hypothetical protein AAF098_19675 [Pseudomonadota bacterium]